MVLEKFNITCNSSEFFIPDYLLKEDSLKRELIIHNEQEKPFDKSWKINFPVQEEKQIVGCILRGSSQNSSSSKGNYVRLGGV